MILPIENTTLHKTFIYKGEVDSEGKACGYGIAKWDNMQKIVGTWYDDKPHGISKKNFCLINIFRREINIL